MNIDTYVPSKADLCIAESEWNEVHPFQKWATLPVRKQDQLARDVMFSRMRRIEAISQTAQQQM